MSGMTVAVIDSDSTDFSARYIEQLDAIESLHVRPMALDSAAQKVRTGKLTAYVLLKPGFGEQMIPLWQSDTRKLYEAVETMLATVTAETDRAERLVAEAEAILQLIRVDGSWGAHNPRYTEAILRRAIDRLTEAGAVAPPESALPEADEPETDHPDAEPAGAEETP